MNAFASATDAELARQLLEVIPPLMHEIRQELWLAAQGSLSVPQYRILANVHRGLRHVGQIAEHHGVSQPAMSKMVEGLVRKNLLKRTHHPGDRRQVVLELTEDGEALFRRLRKGTQARLSQRLKGLGAGERRRLSEGLEQIASIFLPDRAKENPKES